MAIEIGYLAEAHHGIEFEGLAADLPAFLATPVGRAGAA